MNISSSGRVLDITDEWAYESGRIIAISASTNASSAQ